MTDRRTFLSQSAILLATCLLMSNAKARARSHLRASEEVHVRWKGRVVYVVSSHRELLEDAIAIAPLLALGCTLEPQ
jgi:uncharacterized membrane protein